MSAEISADRADDLTRISGIGPKIARRLNEAGIWTYGDLASRSAADIGKLIPDISGMSAGRVDGWRQQAQELAATLPASDAVPAIADAARDGGQESAGQHYESFLVRVLLNEDLSIRSTAVQHIRTGAARRWPGWQPDALTSLIATMVAEHGPERVEHREQRAAGAVASAAGGAEAEPRVRWKSGGRRRQPAAARITVPGNVLAAGERFLLTLSLDLDPDAVMPDPLAYSTVVVARPLAGGPKRTVARADGLLPGGATTFQIGGEGLPSGTYRIEGAVSLREPGADPPDGMAVLVDGLILEVGPA